MVRIVNGEIVQDDDNRQQGNASSAAREPNTSRQEQAVQSNVKPFLQRQPFKVRWDVPPLWGLQLPAIEVFELFVSAQQMLILAALGWAFGWRVVLFLAIVFVVVKMNSGPPAAPRQAAQQSGPGVAADFMRDYMANNPSNPSSTANNPWSSRGKGQKLGSKSNAA